jgi:hypothetical protein
MWGRPPTTPTTRHGLLALRLPGDSPVTLLRGDDPLEAHNWLSPLNPSLSFYTIQSIRKLYTPPNNSEAQQEPGGPPTPPHYRMIIRSRGVSSVPPSMAITEVTFGSNYMRPFELI